MPSTLFRLASTAALAGMLLGAAAPLDGPLSAAGQSASARPGAPAPTAGANAGLPDYLIGADDVLSIVFWREPDVSRDVVVRPDGRISLPLINDIAAAGLTPEQLRVSLEKAAEKYLEDPRATVVVKQINSRQVYITGQVAKQGTYALTTGMTVMQLITVAGGILEFADDDNITIVRLDGGKTVSFRFNYQEVKRRRNLEQNIELKPGDTVIVP
jgi:polysaccharide export outer membrane protein